MPRPAFFWSSRSADPLALWLGLLLPAAIALPSAQAAPPPPLPGSPEQAAPAGLSAAGGLSGPEGRPATRLSGAAPSPPPPPSGAALLQGDEPLLIGPGLPLAPARPAPLPLAPASLGAVDPPAPSTPPATPPPAGSPQPATAIPAGRELVLDRRRRQLRVVENGRTLHRFPVAVGMPGWETPVGRFQVIEKRPYPIWEHPEKGTRTPPGPDNPLGSRWIGFHRDCNGRRGWDGESMLDVKGCVVAGFHGTPHRWTVGHAVSHGCVRLYDEHVRTLYELVSLGMPVTVLP